MKKTKEEILSLFEEFRSSEYYSRWIFADKILCDMCNENPFHNDADVVAGKMLMIGRSYAAAVERRIINLSMDNDDFYYEKVVKVLMEESSIIDDLIGRIKYLNKKQAEEFVPKVHYYLVRKLRGITGVDKKSLVSKYLHFHCPEKVYVFDSYAEKEIKSINSTRLSKNKIPEDVDDIYYKFYLKMLELNKILSDKTPKELDKFVLWLANYKKI